MAQATWNYLAIIILLHRGIRIRCIFQTIKEQTNLIPKRFWWIILSFVFVSFVVMGVMFYRSPATTKSELIHPIIETSPAAAFINMTEDEMESTIERQMFKMILDTATGYRIDYHVFRGLAYHESDRFRQAYKKRIDSNNKYSYGLFQIQFETAKLYDKNVTEKKLLTPAYNAHIAAIIFSTNLVRYNGDYELTIAAHNAGYISHGHIANMDFVKKVNAAIGDLDMQDATALRKKTD